MSSCCATPMHAAEIPERLHRDIDPDLVAEFETICDSLGC
jgi:hypothetical protein